MILRKIIKIIKSQSHIRSVTQTQYQNRFNKAGCVFPMAMVLILHNAEFGRNDHREDALHCKTKGTL